MTDRFALAEGIDEKAPRVLQAIAGSMAFGVLVLAGLALWFRLGATQAPAPADVKLINAFTTAVMAWCVGAIVFSEFLWKRQLRAITNPAHAPSIVQTAFIVRLALREGAALLGLVACLLAAMKGVLTAYPAYWVNAAPAALFLFFLAVSWPSREGLRRQVLEALDSL